MVIQFAQNSCCIGAAAAHTGLTGDPLGDTDFQAVGILLDGIQIQLRGLPCQIGFVGGNAGLVALQHPGLTGTHINFDIITDGDSLHDTF